MNLLEAVSRNKAFKRKSKPDWIDPNFAEISITKDDLLAGDWEIRKKSKELTKEEIVTAIQAGGSLAEITRRLGLEE